MVPSCQVQDIILTLIEEDVRLGNLTFLFSLAIQLERIVDEGDLTREVEKNRVRSRESRYNVLSIT